MAEVTGREVAAPVADDTCRCSNGQPGVVSDLPLPGCGRYREALLERYANPRMHHGYAQIAADGSQKLPVRILPVLRQQRAGSGGARPGGWPPLVTHLRGAGADVRADQMVALAGGPLPGAVRRVLDALDPALGSDDELVNAVSSAGVSSARSRPGVSEPDGEATTMSEVSDDVEAGTVDGSVGALAGGPWAPVVILFESYGSGASYVGSAVAAALPAPLPRAGGLLRAARGECAARRAGGAARRGFLDAMGDASFGGVDVGDVASAQRDRYDLVVQNAAEVKEWARAGGVIVEGTGVHPAG